MFFGIRNNLWKAVRLPATPISPYAHKLHPISP
jgi:hypothetical protein